MIWYLILLYVYRYGREEQSGARSGRCPGGLHLGLLRSHLSHGDEEEPGEAGKRMLFYSSYSMPNAVLL